MPRHMHQAMGYWLNEPAILNPALLDDAVADLATAGYGIVRVMLRSTNFTHRSSAVVAAVTHLVAAAHAHGLRVALDCEPHADPVGRDMGAQFPGAMGSRLVRGQTRVYSGQFLVRLPCPHGEASLPQWEGVESAFLQQDGAWQRIPELACGMRWELEAYADDDFHADQPYRPGKAGKHQYVCVLTGMSDAPNGTEIVVYGRFADSRLVDFWADDFRAYYQSLLECYRDVPLDGIGWDEPSVGGDWSHYRYGEAFARAFESRCGYILADRLHLLDAPGLSPDAVRVRLDYYGTLNEGVAQAQEEVIRSARALFCKDILLGTHHTWQGEGGINDYRAGAVDYFRLSDAQDAGYTDCCWWDEASVCYAYVLAVSLARRTPSGEAEVNTWHWKPTAALVAYHSRLMSLMQITWFNIWYGQTSDTCLYPAHETWDVTVQATREHRERQQQIGAARPVTEVAVWHGWEGVCGLNRADMAGAHKAFCLNISHLLVERSVAFDFVDSRILAEAHVVGGQMQTPWSRYTVLVLPYAAVLPQDVWQQCMAFARAGGKLVFVGPPPDQDTAGQPLGGAFAALLEMPPLSAADYLGYVDAVCSLPPDRPDFVDVAYPVPGAGANGVRSRAGNVVYLPDLDPRERLLDCLEPWLSLEVSCFSDSIMWRLYREPGRDVLTLIARKQRRMCGVVRFGEHVLEIEDGVAAIVERQDATLTLHGDETFRCWEKGEIG